MSSVEGSDRGEDSLSDQQELVLKNNKIQRNKHNSRGLRNANSEDSLYKQALKEYMFGRFDLASQNCKKMIANNPDNPQPYFLMANMYQQAATKNNDQNQLYKSVQYFFFHAYYSQPSVEKWLKVADMSYDLDLYQQAAYCYGRALKMNKSNLQICLKRAECLQMCLQIKKAANIYKRIIEKYSNSTQFYKRYAKLRFKREQYSKARQILLSYPEYKQDLNIKYMIAETYLKQRKFPELYAFILQNIIQNADPPIENIYEQLELQFLEMLFICVVNCPNQVSEDLKLTEMLEYFINEYDPEEKTLYDEIISYIKKQNPDVTYKLLNFLIGFQAHQTIENYLYCSEYLMKSWHCQEAIKVLENGLSTEKNSNSVELKTQLNYLKSLLKNKNKNRPISPAPSKLKSLKAEDIYYSDEENLDNKQDQISQKMDTNRIINQDSDDDYQIKLVKNGKTKKIQKSKNRKRSHTVPINRIQVKDPDIVSKLINNNQLTLLALKNQVENLKENNQGSAQLRIKRTFSQVKECLQYLIEIQSSTRDERNEIQQVGSKKSQSIFNNRQPKRRRMITSHNSRKNNIISRNSTSLLQSLKSILFFLKQYMKIQKYAEVIDIAQLLSKAHFFKWQNRIVEFKSLKREVYEIGLLGCLQLKKYGKSIFFLRYLINKNPLNEFYLGIAEKIMRLSAGKLFINKMLKKDPELINFESEHQKCFVKIHYMTGLQYMQNCFFELAINMFVRVLQILESPETPNSPEHRQMCKTTYMCMSTCFLQMASSRTMYNKIDQINRSAYCLARYKNQYQNPTEIQIQYNQARWYSYIKLYNKAIPLYKTILASSTHDQIISRCVLSLMIIYKDIGDYEQIKQLSYRYYQGEML